MTDGNVPFVLPCSSLSDFLDRAPMFRPIARALPGNADAGSRIRCERLLTRLFLRTLYFPRLTEIEARRIADHGMPQEELVEQEIGFMRRHQEWRSVLHDWSQVWNAAETDGEFRFIRYCTALLARLYRLEYDARLRRTDARAVA